MYYKILYLTYLVNISSLRTIKMHFYIIIMQNDTRNTLFNYE